MSAWPRLMVASCIWAAGVAGTSLAAAPDIPIVPDDIGGIVTSMKGPEAGVWVIAETTSLPTRFVKIVVTDDQGCRSSPWFRATPSPAATSWRCIATL
ncbi:MAG: hypothetical protein JWM91_2741 [Rhodospirillales bacterium]|nr:hypothetical protein [Rhodospirillales bacterium]